MNTHSIAILGFLIVLSSLIAPWPFGNFGVFSVSISLLELYYGFIIGILSGAGLFFSGAFTATNWNSFAVMIVLVAYPIGLYFSYKSVRWKQPSIYQGVGGVLSGVLWIAAVFTALPNFTNALGPYLAIIGGLILELAYFMSGSHSSSTRYHSSGHGPYTSGSHGYERTPIFYWVAILVIALLINILIFFKFIQANTELYSILNTLSNFILYLPGIIVFPLIVGVLIGREVGHSANTIKYAVRIGFLKSIYACLTYVISIIILYLIFFYTLNNAPDIQYLILYWLILPSVVLIAASILGAIVSYSKHLE